ncbi:hypothetical protein [Streptomyces sp. NPDC050355]|uniref:hypothetical protein n=1 Tax=Streptomyces sp. NPDC050355 TaxID=3365609 RepID=UPI0037A85D88
MKIYRAKVRPGFIAIDNKTEDADLSCRALGLLTRWLRFPEGAEVPSIPELVKERKRRGCKRIEGRDALYSASYELEAEGFLVRSLVRGEGGQHEWAAFIYPHAVPPEERSDPEGRKRRSGPVPENPEPAPTCDDAAPPVPDFQEPGTQESANQESETQEASSTNRGQSSSSSSSTVRPSSAGQPKDDEDETQDHKTQPSAEANPASRGSSDTEHEAQAPAGETATPTAEVRDFIAGLPGMDRKGPRDHATLYPRAAVALAAGWAPKTLTAHLTREVNPSRCRNLAAVYGNQLDNLPTPPAALAPPKVREGHCPTHPHIWIGDGSACTACDPRPSNSGMARDVLAAARAQLAQQESSSASAADAGHALT